MEFLLTLFRDRGTMTRRNERTIRGDLALTSDDTTKALRIKKYANRRFYDATRSCHVTLGEMHDLIQRGYRLEIADAQTGDDITQVVLTQLILERDPPKLGIFPSNVLHDVIRTQKELLGPVIERFFAQTLQTHKASHDQWTRFLKNTLGLPELPSGPMDWPRQMMEAWAPEARTSESDGSASNPSGNREIEALRDQVAELTRQVERLAANKT